MDIQINVKGAKDGQRPTDSRIVDRCANVLREHGYKVVITWEDKVTPGKEIVLT